MTRTDALGQTTSYEYYGPTGELTRMTYPNTTFVSYNHDLVGNLIQMNDSTGQTNYWYDNLNRMTSVAFPGGKTVTYGYDAASQRTSLGYPNGGGTVNYTYDAAGRLSTVTDWAAQTTSYSYDVANRLIQTTLPASTGVVSMYAYDNADRLNSLAHYGPGWSSWVINGRDGVGNVTSRIDSIDGWTSYTYDNLYRLTNVAYPAGSPFGAFNASYTYDAAGNRTASVTPNWGTSTYSYDAGQRLVSSSDDGQVTNYTWNTNGNLVNQGGAIQHVWDYENRLTSRASGFGGPVTSLTYRGDGLRHSRQVGYSPATYFAWDVNTAVPQVLTENSAKYVYGLGRIARYYGSTPTYYLSDGLGSVIGTVNASGALTNQVSYDAYGEQTDGSTPPGGFGFAGEQSDGSTGLQYLRARYYDPKLGIFISRDPMAARPGWTGSPYGYAGANPANRIDPTGLAPMAPEDNCRPPDYAIFLPTYCDIDPPETSLPFVDILRNAAEWTTSRDWGSIFTLNNWVTVVQFLDTTPFGLMCVTAVVLLSGDPLAAPVAAGPCAAVEAALGIAAGVTFQYQIVTSDCSVGIQMAATFLNAGSMALDPVMVGWVGEFAIYTFGSALIQCGG